METYQGEDITPLWDLKGKGLPWSHKHLYAAPKLGKIVFMVKSFRNKLMSYGTSICDIPYMEHYLEPLEDAFSKGMEYFPSLGTGKNL